MRTNYPLSSKELNDKLLTAYAHYVHLLGYDNEYGVTTYSGVYDINEESLKDTHKYITLSNDYYPPNSGVNQSIPKYLDSVMYKQSLGKSVAGNIIDQPGGIGNIHTHVIDQPGGIGYIKG